MGLKRRVRAYSVTEREASSPSLAMGVIQFLCNAVVAQRSTLRPFGSRLVTDLVGGASTDLRATLIVPKPKTSSVLH